MPSDLNLLVLVPFLGRLHPMLVHFPLGFLVAAAFLEWRARNRFDSGDRAAIGWLLKAGLATALMAALFGWLLSQNEEYGASQLALHQWSGFATCGVMGAAWWLLRKLQANYSFKTYRTYKWMLTAGTVGVLMAGHWGAALTHGSDYLSSVLPWNGSSNKTIDFKAGDTVKLGAAELTELGVQAKSILAHNCYKCHGSEKVKGDLRLDSRDLMIRGGENGSVLELGDPEKSELFRRISLPENHKDLMPSKEKKLSEKEITLLGYWIKQGAPWPTDQEVAAQFRDAPLAPRNPALPDAPEAFSNPVDKWTYAYFKANNIAWAKPVDDRTYLRRIYLDIIGLLPSPESIKEFETDSSADKRAKWVRKLLDRNDDYATHWLSFWNDALRNDYTGTGYITGGRFNITNWLYQSLQNNKPYDQFVRELLNPADESKGFIAGIKWRGEINASQRTEMQAAQNVAQSLLGLNLKCASCHNSFVSNWKLEDAYAFANIFADSALEINRCDKPTGKYIRPRLLWAQLGSIDSNAKRSEKLAQLAAQLIRPENGRLYRTLVNRVWSQLMGRGLVEPVDVMDNQPWNQDLLDWLAYHFQASGSNTKELIYLICTSRTYQLPSIGLKGQEELTAKNYLFRGRIRKRMSAEQFADASSWLVSPLFPDSLVAYRPKLKEKKRVDTFVRASLVVNNRFLIALGRPNRETVAMSRESQANLLQSLEMTNGIFLDNALKTKAHELFQSRISSKDLVTGFYQKALARNASAREMQIALGVLGAQPTEEGIRDFLWAVLQLPEFQLIN